MSVRIEIHQARTVEEGPLYRIYTEVIHAVGISRAIFVFETESETFSHVATTWDMETFPDTLAEAQATAANYYRQDRCTKDYEEESVASSFAVYTRGRIDYLVRQYAGMQEDFIGEDDYEFVGG